MTAPCHGEAFVWRVLTAMGRRLALPVRSPYVRYALIGLAVSACASGPDALHDPGRPRLSALTLHPAVVAGGCPVSVNFQFADPHGDVIGARVYWRQQRGARSMVRGVVPLSIDPAVFSGQPHGQVTGTLTLRFEGRYDLAVQLEDAGGRTSNLVKDFITVTQPALWGQAPCRMGTAPASTGSPLTLVSHPIPQ